MRRLWEEELDRKHQVLRSASEHIDIYRAQGALAAIEAVLERVEKITKEANEAKEENSI